MITNELKERIKQAARIEDIIGDYVSLKKKGVNYVGMCPFHDDKTPSLVVSGVKGMYKCFACGAGGDSIEFVKNHEHVSYPEAVKLIAKRVNIEVPSVPMSEDERRAMDEREALLLVNKRAHAFYVDMLAGDTGASSWLAGRGLSAEMIAEFRLGYAPDGNKLCVMGANGTLNQKAAEQLALIKRNERGGNYDAFRDRVVYPFLSNSGNIIGFTGRKMNWNKGDATAKFLNSDESALFKKDRAIFGLFQAKRHIAQYDRVYWVEGQHDVIMLHQCGVKNAVCGSGTAFNENHAREVMRFTRNITFVFDGDGAGQKATVKAIDVAVRGGANVRVIGLPEGEDPDSFARKHPGELALTLGNMEQGFVDYLLKLRAKDVEDEYEKEQVVDELAGLVACIDRAVTRDALVKKVSRTLDIDEGVFAGKARAKAGGSEAKKLWVSGVNGLEEAKELLKDNVNLRVYLTFDESQFLIRIDSEPIVYVRGALTKSAVQNLRMSLSEVYVGAPDNDYNFGMSECQNMETLKALHLANMKINIFQANEDSEAGFSGFLDYYVSGYASYIRMNITTENDRAVFIDRCAEMISAADITLRTVVMKGYAKDLGLTQADLKAIVQPYLEKKKDRAVLEKRNMDTEGDLFSFDSEIVPAYVEEDEALKRQYLRDNFYPVINKQGVKVAYMVKNEKGGGHTCISDFYMEPLLHVYNRESEANKRVIRLNHIHGNSQYVEWKSSILATLSKVNEKLIDEGSFNFEGSMFQFKRIWKTMSYQFKKCTEMRVFGQQPEEFWAFSNAVIYDETDDSGNVETRIAYADHLGVMGYKDRYYYSPSQSEIYNSEREEDDKYKMERYFSYKDVPGSMRIDFAEWARRMDTVYSINDNGKWAVLLSALSCFRDYIFSQRRFFTTLFFIGPTGSGKSQVAESMRSLFMPPEAPVFNLNFGSDASFFIVLESYRNVISIMEEYNDNTISATKFQGLKAAVFDGEGKTKVKDIATKSLDRSKINSIPVILGQEAPQQDDGSLSNRCILCDVPYKGKGDWTEEETHNYEELKRREQAGLQNVLLEIISERSTVKRYFNSVFTEEVKLLKLATNGQTTNTDGLTRIVNSVALVTSIARIITKYTSLELPFSYDDFFEIAVDKVLKQVEMISRSNKLANYFSAISYLINQGKIRIGKELKVSVPKNGRVTVKKGTRTEEYHLPTVETKVLYINMDTTYPLYQQTTKDALTKASLESYFKSNKAFVGLTKSTQFKWYEDGVEMEERYNSAGDYTGEKTPRKQLRMQTNNTSAYMFDYDMLKDLMDVDFEREEEPEEVLTEDSKPF